MSGLRLYFRYISISVKSQLQYRASFLLQATGQFLLTGVEFLGVWALFDRFGGLKGWSLAECAMFYGIVSITFAISDAFARGFDWFGNLVKNGDFDRLLLRPRSTVLQVIGQELTLRRCGRLLQGLAVLLWAIPAVDVRWTISDVGVLLLAVVGGICVFTGLMILEATSAFWTTEALEVWAAFIYGGVFMSQYPAEIYRPWFRQFFTYVIPLTCVTYFPVVAVLDRPDALAMPRLFYSLSPLAGVLFLLVALQVWQFGVMHYRSTGS